MLGGLLKATSNRLRNSVIDMAKVFARKFSGRKPFFPCCRVLKKKKIIAFCRFRSSPRLLFFFFSSLIGFSLAALYRFSAFFPRFSSDSCSFTSCSLFQDWNLSFRYLWSVKTIDIQIFFRNSRQLFHASSVHLFAP